MSPVFVMKAVATRPAPAIPNSPTKQGTHTAHQSAALKAYLGDWGTRADAMKTSDPNSRNMKMIAAKRRRIMSQS
jgi:hypothetical protein